MSQAAERFETRFQKLRLTKWSRKLFRASQVLIGLIDPIGAGRIEDIEVDSIFDSLGFMRHVGGNAEDLARVNDDFLAVDPKFQGTIENVGQLLVVVAVFRN